MYPREIGGSSNRNLDLDRAKLSARPTPDTSRSSRGMRPNDQARTSDSSQSRPQELTLAMMTELRGLRNDLKEANQKVLDLTQEREGLINTNRELANQLERANRKIEELANQLKQARSDGTSSLQKKREASSRSDKAKELAIRNWFEEEWKKKKDGDR